MKSVRRSTRNVTRKSYAIDLDSDDDDARDVPLDLPLKRPATASGPNGPVVKKRRNLRGFLRMMKDVPLDVVYEVFGHLDPLDLLQLSRTSKQLRHLLLQDSARSVWKTARSNVDGLPDIPPDLNEAQYAQLLFGTYCQSCLKPARRAQWETRTRLCKKCFLTSPDFIDWMSPQIDSPWRLYNPLVSMDDGRAMYFRYHRLYTQKLKQSYGNVKDDSEQLQKWRENAKMAYKNIKEHAEKCESWYQSRVERRGKELLAIRFKRLKDISDRLRTLGWAEEIEKTDPAALLSHKLIWQPRPLTDRIWAGIEMAIVTYMEELKASRLLAERLRTLGTRSKLFTRLYKAFLATQPSSTPYPSPVDALISPPVKTIIVGTPITQELTEASFSDAFARFSDYSKQWKETADTEIGLLMKEVNQDKSHLHLATTTFLCRSCKKYISYPRILSHSCTTVGWLVPNGLDDDETVMRRSVLPILPWSTRADMVPSQWRNTCQLIELVCNLDPSITTTQDMNSWDPVFTCIPCSNDWDGRLLMRWEQAILHTIHTDTHESIDVVLKLVTNEQELRLFEVLESNAASERKLGVLQQEGILSIVRLRCNHCDLMFISREMTDHLRNDHSVLVPSPSDFNWHLDDNRLIRSAVRVPNAYFV
ncbi:uncharacterized protein BT62DRAFT_990614 [Guyanagaster necrorhizus]|uniref:F-box domain-containing protein n=1 Tax=Guyanagaster necrorhizus TaxID=856835 RepID=A0A9P8AYD3_9AGAR|nr:uncharacterized protein BT62DRAFT_990614 [Guyanagaster necrorhizus MCA 3950]KAG7452375.1 hypothetical protein BT62DRAFT_990614 [Guyanagaster necrorhizus MCA 3950]